MSFFMINGHDYSAYVRELNVTRAATYRSQTNAAGNTVVDNCVAKRVIEVSIIPVFDDVMSGLLDDVYGFEAYVSFRNPNTNQLEQNVHCIIPESEVQYKWIRSDSVLYEELSLEFTEL